jgi:DNA-binding XRE family transcriptional regulator
MLTPRLIRTARALLGWDQPTLAREAGISLPTVTRIEAGADDDPPSGTAKTAAAVQAAFEGAGIIFVAADDAAGAGVRMGKAKGRTRGSSR